MTLTGPPGAGKTRLAMELATGIADRPTLPDRHYRDGVVAETNLARPVGDDERSALAAAVDRFEEFERT